jgi:predicted nucleic acid-binding protein
MAVTIDASVFVNAFSPVEVGSDKSLVFILQLGKQNIPIIQPVLVLPEIAAALSRRQGSSEAALQLVKEIKSLPSITFINVDESISSLAVDIAANNRLRGSDAVYAAVALRFGTELITLDREQLDQLPKVLPVRAP